MASKRAKNTNILIKTVAQFLKDNGDESHLYKVAAELSELAKRSQGEQKIVVTSALSLDDEQKQKIQSWFKIILSKDYSVSNKVDRAVLGGLKLEWGDWMLDMTLRGRLEVMRKNLL